MSHLNVEFKARCEDSERIRKVLRNYHAEFKGEDRQVDTYFNSLNGRLKLREGTLENNLIHYERDDAEGPKQSHVTLFTTQPGTTLKDLLTKSMGVKVVVDKRREIYWIRNVKFHIDNVEGLGSFIEVEAVDYDNNIGKDKLTEQCERYLKEFKINAKDLISCSYSDLLLQKQS